jgi:hypothetical protein
MQTVNQVFSITTRVLAVCDHSLLRRANLSFALNQPFAWSLINSAAVLARMLDEHKVSAESLDSEIIRKDLLTSEFDIEKADQLIIKLATLRHFNRLACGANEIGMGTINACLKPDESEVSLDAIKQTARDRVKIERRMGKLKPTGVAARFEELVTGMYQTEVERKRQTRRLMDEVFFLCNRSDDMLFVGNYEQELQPNTAYKDGELADFDQYAYLSEALAEKCVEPVIRAKTELQNIMDRSYRTQALADCTLLMKELDKLAVELGINFAKIDAENAKIDAEIAQAEAASAKTDAEIDAAIDELDVKVEADAPVAPEHRQRVTIKSPERLAREAAEAEARAKPPKPPKPPKPKNKEKATKAAATRAANKAKATAAAITN